MACTQSPDGKHRLVKWRCDDPMCCEPHLKQYAEECRYCGEPMGNARRKWKRERDTTR